MRRLAILGASGHGKVVADAALTSGWDSVLFYDDAYPGKCSNGKHAIWGDSAALFDAIVCGDVQGIVIAIGDNKIRHRILSDFIQAKMPLVSVIHPSAIISPSAVIGPGSVVLAGAVVNADACIGAGCIINTNAVVEHDCLLADCVHISPAASLAGGTVVGCGVWVGIGAVTKQSISIGQYAIVGAGAAVIHNVDAGVTVVGVPAQLLEGNRSPAPA